MELVRKVLDVGIDDETANSMSECVIGIFVNDGACVPKLCGSGVLLEKNGLVYLCTAAHVLLDNGANCVLETPVRTSEVNSSWMTITGEVLCSSPKKHDVAVLCMGNVSDGIFDGVGKKPLPIERTASNEEDRYSKRYVIVGYPASRTKYYKGGDFKVPPNLSLCMPQDKRFYDEFSLDPKLRVAVKYGKKINFDGSIGRSPRPDGMSGGGIWSIPIESGKMNVRERRLVGILTNQNSRWRAIYASDISIAFKLIDSISGG